MTRNEWWTILLSLVFMANLASAGWAGIHQHDYARGAFYLILAVLVRPNYSKDGAR